MAQGSATTTQLGDKSRDEAYKKCSIIGIIVSTLLLLDLCIVYYWRSRLLRKLQIRPLVISQTTTAVDRATVQAQNSESTTSYPNGSTHDPDRPPLLNPDLYTR